MNDNIIFTSLPANVSTLGLLQGVESFAKRGKALSYNFIHLAIQEILAGFYMATQLSASEQASKFSELFNNSRFAAVFQFYAGITKLQTPGINDIVTKIAKTYENGFETRWYTRKTLLLSLLHCLYEAQEPTLCESVARQLQRGMVLYGHPIDHSMLTLTPLDCLCIGYFLSNVCNLKTTAGEFNVDLSSCNLSSQSCKYLVSGLHTHLSTYCNSRVNTILNMNLRFNAICDINDFSKLLQTDCINALFLDQNYLSDKGVRIFAEQLKSNTSLKVLSMFECGLQSKGFEYLVDALTINNSLKELYFVGAPCDNIIEQQLAHALTVNHGLKVLNLDNCGMTDKGLKNLAKSLQHNGSLERLNIGNGDIYYEDEGKGVFCSHNHNTITKEGILVLIECLKNNKSLMELIIPDNSELSMTAQEAVNESRKKRGLPLIR